MAGKTNSMLTNGEKTPQDIGFHPLPEPEYPPQISLAALQEAFAGCEDLECRRIRSGGGAEFWLCWLEGVADGAEVAEQVIRPLTSAERFQRLKDAGEALQAAEQGLVYAAASRRRTKSAELVSDLCNGFCCLIAGTGALSFQLRSRNHRSVDAPQTEKTLLGGKDAFVEQLRVNTALVRNRLRSPKLKLHQCVLGRKSRSNAAVMWLEGVADESVVQQLTERLQAIDCDGLLQAGSLAEALCDAPRSPFPQLMHSERSDVFSMALLEGRVGLFVEGLPLGFLVPGALPAMMVSAEDEAQHFLVASALRLLRWGALLLTLFLPALYVAMAMYHQEMIPLKLLLSIIESKQRVPFPTSAEILGMLIAFELLQEAGLRLPDSIGQTVSIVGALIVGQSAVEARVISPIAVIVVAMTGIAGYTMPNQDLSGALRLSRFVLVLAAIAAGMFGVMVAAAALIWHLCSLESFGRAYLSPLSSGRPGSGRRSLLRVPGWKNKFRPADIHGGDGRRRR